MFRKLKAMMLIVLCTCLFSTGASAVKDSKSSFADKEILLWDGAAPGSENVELTQQIIERSKDPKVLDRAIVGISKPSIIPFFPAKGKANGTAVLIMPGGGYERVVFDKEGYDIAQWLNSKGVTAFVLKYRLPAEGHDQGHLAPLQDAQRAMRLIRENASEWGINADSLGVLGLSAGGHLASTLGTKYDEEVYKATSKTDQQSARPDFMILNYPVISMDEEITHAGSRKNLLGAQPSDEMAKLFSSELNVDQDTPPAFIVHANDDTGVPSKNSVLFYQALNEANVEAEMHIFRKGGHGFGIRLAEGPISLWTELAEEWMEASGFME
ncbi:alpha/beta hydrolase [Mesobacillus foraminis]|uniref:Acetyl esterase/lipase n=1 Tax=Mesobacillus foraminis TaxID=279826 RepID=A0A4R2BF62_9BACI|nr:alpha/beta hydrolase [Mesobacillus foraminis]TCN25095.1 acetyl esterase/lipase [Mesobacillus foraminis]